MPQSSTHSGSLFCDRCGAILAPGGKPPFYVVRIEAFADPSPPRIAGDESPAELADQYDDLLAQMRGMSEQELMDQVHRRMTLHLCAACYANWIEDPTGSLAGGG